MTKIILLVFETRY